MKKINVLAIWVISLVLVVSVSAVAQEAWNVVTSNQKFMVDGKEVNVDALNINGYNYAKIADIAQLLDIDIAYDQKTNTVSIDRSKQNSDVNQITNNEPQNNEGVDNTSNTPNDPYEVFSYAEFIKATESTVNTIVVKRDIDVSGEFASVKRNQTVIIEKGITLNISMYNFNVYGKIINHGTINVLGRIVFYEESPEIGVINTEGYGEINFAGDVVGLDEINRILGKDSIYTSLSFVPAIKREVLIDKDLTIDAGKMLWLNSSCTLVVAKDVTLTIKGTLILHGEQIIHGKVVGKITTPQ